MGEKYTQAEQHKLSELLKGVQQEYRQGRRWEHLIVSIQDIIEAKKKREKGPPQNFVEFKGNRYALVGYHIIVRQDHEEDSGTYSASEGRADVELFFEDWYPLELSGPFSICVIDRYSLIEQHRVYNVVLDGQSEIESVNFQGVYRFSLRSDVRLDRSVFVPSYTLGRGLVG